MPPLGAIPRSPPYSTSRSAAGASRTSSSCAGHAAAGHHLNWAAALDCLGCLQSRSVVAGDVEVCPGDRVVVGPSGIGRPGGSGIPEGWPGDIRPVLRADDCGEVYPRLAEPGEVANARLRTVEDPDHVDFLDAELAERLPDLAVALIRSCVSSRERSIGIQTPGTATRRAGSASRTSTVESTPSASSRPSRRTSSAAGSWTPPLAAGYSERWLGNGSSPRCTDRRPSSRSTPTSGTMSCLTLATAPSRRSAPARSKPGSRTGLRCWHRPR